MTKDPHAPEILESYPNDVEAAAVVTALEAHGISATATGGFTAGFRAEAPGSVNVVVRRCDMPRARSVLAELREQRDESD